MKTIFTAIEPFIERLEKLDWDERGNVSGDQDSLDFDDYVIEAIGSIPKKGQPFFKEYQTLSNLAEEASAAADRACNPGNTGFGGSDQLQYEADCLRDFEKASAKLAKFIQ